MSESCRQPAVTCWRCKIRAAARMRLKPWKHGALCRGCRDEIDRALLEVALVVFLVRRPRW